MSVVEVRGLRVELAANASVAIVEGVDFSLESGEIVGLVGESGCGKTTVSTSLLGYARTGAQIAGGTVLIDGQDVLAMDEAQLQALRGKQVSYIPQDPAAALNPARRIESQVREILVQHEPDCSKAQAHERIVEAMEEVGLPSDQAFLRKFPHQISGGQQQRVCIAMAFLLRPKVIVLDEPTTGLDVTTQAQVLRTVRKLCDQFSVAALYVTHDLAVVANLADRLMVMYAGRVVELGPTTQVVRQAGHPYSRKLLEAIPAIHRRRTLETIPGRAPAPAARPPACTFAPRCEFVVDACLAEEPPLIELPSGNLARCIRARELPRPAASVAADAARDGRTHGGDTLLSVRDAVAGYAHVTVLQGVSLDVRAGECLALVGESGSGKTTLSRSIIGLHTLTSGEVRFQGQVLAGHARSRPAEVRRRVQYVFQSPYNALNQRRTVGNSIAAPAQVFFSLGRRELRERVEEALDRVSLPAEYARRFPAELSGGERQRVAIARALICQPDLLICDEITSALDVSVQASIVEVLGRLQQEGLGMLFVTHNLALVRTIADRVVILNQGRIVEDGGVARVLDAPQDAYTTRLLSDTPSIEIAFAGTSGTYAQP